MDQTLNSPTKQGNQDFTFEFSNLFQQENLVDQAANQQIESQKIHQQGQAQANMVNQNQNQQPFYAPMNNNFSIQEQENQFMSNQNFHLNNNGSGNKPNSRGNNRRASNSQQQGQNEKKGKAQQQQMQDFGKFQQQQVQNNDSQMETNNGGMKIYNKIEESENMQAPKGNTHYSSYDNMGNQNNENSNTNHNNGNQGGNPGNPNNKKWPNVKQESNNSLCGMQNLQTIKGNVKNTYIKKINSLLNVQELGQESSDEQEKIKRVMSHDILKIEQTNGGQNYVQQPCVNGQPQHQSAFSQQHVEEIKNKQEEDEQENPQEMMNQYMNYSDGNDDPDNSDLNGDKLQHPLTSKPLLGDDKVKESAKNSRLRKKLYIELLEKKVTTLSKQIDQSYEDIRINRSNIGLILKQNPYLQAFITKRHENFQSIAQAQGCEKQDEKQLSLILDSFNYRLGAQGKTRIFAMDTFFLSMLGTFLNWNISLFLLGNQQYVQPNEEAEFHSCIDVFQKATNYMQRDSRINSIFKRIFTHRKQFMRAVKKVRTIKKKMEASIQRIDKFFSQIEFDIKPQNQAKLVLKVEKNRRKAELVKFCQELDPPQLQIGKRKIEELDTRFEEDLGMFPPQQQSSSVPHNYGGRKKQKHISSNNSNSNPNLAQNNNVNNNTGSNINYNNNNPSNNNTNNNMNYNNNGNNNANNVNNQPQTSQQAPQQPPSSQPPQQSQQQQQQQQPQQQQQQAYYNQNYSMMQQGPQNPQQQQNQQYPMGPPPPPGPPPHHQQQNYPPPQPQMPQPQYNQPPYYMNPPNQQYNPKQNYPQQYNNNHYPMNNQMNMNNQNMNPAPGYPLNQPPPPNPQYPYNQQMQDQQQQPQQPQQQYGPPNQQQQQQQQQQQNYQNYPNQNYNDQNQQQPPQQQQQYPQQGNSNSNLPFMNEYGYNKQNQQQQQQQPYQQNNQPQQQQPQQAQQQGQQQQGRQIRLGSAKIDNFMPQDNMDYGDHNPFSRSQDSEIEGDEVIDKKLKL